MRLLILRWWARYCLTRAQFYAGECWGNQALQRDGWDARAPRDLWFARYDRAVAAGAPDFERNSERPAVRLAPDERIQCGKTREQCVLPGGCDSPDKCPVTRQEEAK